MLKRAKKKRVGLGDGGAGTGEREASIPRFFAMTLFVRPHYLRAWNKLY